MSKKRILNATSVKKRDTVLPYSNTTGAQTTYAAGGQIILGNTSGVEATFVYCPTARPLSTAARQSEASRTATTCYQVGYSESVEIQVADGMPWQWRRICFTAKGLPSIVVSPDSTYGGSNGGGGTGGTATNNWTYYSGNRTINQLPPGASRSAMYSILFRGTQSSDWIDPMVAPVDTARVTLKYDKVRTIASGNEDGVIRKYKSWMRMGKNQVYDDDESGSSMTNVPYSVLSKAGQGDYFVIDIFRARTGATTSNQLIFAPQGTMYWHEK